MLGGEANGHVGLVCDSATYTGIPGAAAYMHPLNPGQLTVTSTATQAQITQLWDHHEEALCLFWEVTNVEHTLIQQIVKKIDAKYLNAIRNLVTNKITQTIPSIFSYLFDAYGDVSPSQLQDLQNQVKTFLFDPHEPVDTISTEINQLADLEEIADNLISELQKIDYVYLILQCTSKFNSSLTAWNVKPRIDHTWIKCQTHFWDAQKALRKTGALMVQKALHTEQIVNMVSEGINQALIMKDNQITVQQNKSNLVQQLA
jgi:hypothetical protein